MSYSNQFETEKGIYRLFRTTHGLATMEDIITPERFRTLDGIVLEITGDNAFHNPPDNILSINTHEKVVKMAESLGKKSPAIYVVDVQEEGLVPHLHSRKYDVDKSIFASNSSSKIKIDIYCGAGHKRIPEFIQNKDPRNRVPRKYARDGYSVFDSRYPNVFFEFRIPTNLTRSINKVRCS